MTTNEERKLPADLEGMNNDRAEWARVAVRAFQAETGLAEDDGFDTAIMDLIGDLAHLCDREGLELADLVRRAANHYDAETDPTEANPADYDQDDPDDHDISQDPFGTQFEFMNGKRDDEAPGPCVTCGTQCVADGSLAVICPNCDWKERAITLLRVLGDLGTQDLYTDADEYQNRVGAMQDLCGMAGLLAESKPVTMPDIEAAAGATDEGE